MTSPSEIPEALKAKARDIMDEACLGEPHVSNGVDAVLREAIALALLQVRNEAIAEEREAAAKAAEDARLHWVNGEARTAYGKAYQSGCEHAAAAIRARP